MRSAVWRMTKLAIALVLLASPLAAQRTREIKESGVTATAWMFDVSYAAASGAGYGALRLLGARPMPSAVATASVNVILHVRGWIKGDYQPSADWAFDFVTRGGPAVMLAVCETKGRKACAIAIGALASSYLILAKHASP